MDLSLTLTETPAPLREELSDDPAELLRFAIREARRGPVALATLIEIRAGAARALGSHVVIASDGRYCGYVSGGCVEAAVAAEALQAIAEGNDRVVLLGQGSPFLDIVLPCGGGITVAIHVLTDISRPIEHVLKRLEARQPTALTYSFERHTLAVTQPPERSFCDEGRVVTVYRPDTRLIVSGHNVEAMAVERIALAAGYGVVRIMNSVLEIPIDAIDEYTAVVLLNHDIEAEEKFLHAALTSPAFYIGALGSGRTHKFRSDRLLERGFLPSQVDRIKAPIGIFGPTRDSTSLALSVVADVSAARLAIYPQG